LVSIGYINEQKQFWITWLNMDLRDLKYNVLSANKPLTTGK